MPTLRFVWCNLLKLNFINYFNQIEIIENSASYYLISMEPQLNLGR